MLRGIVFKRILGACVLMGAAVFVSGCATETSRTMEVQKVASAGVPYAGQRSPIVVGKFDNRSSFMRGIFTDGVDRLKVVRNDPDLASAADRSASMRLIATICRK